MFLPGPSQYWFAGGGSMIYTTINLEFFFFCHHVALEPIFGGYARLSYSTKKEGFASHISPPTYIYWKFQAWCFSLSVAHGSFAMMFKDPRAVVSLAKGWFCAWNEKSSFLTAFAPAWLGYSAGTGASPSVMADATLEDFISACLAAASPQRLQTEGASIQDFWSRAQPSRDELFGSSTWRSSTIIPVPHFPFTMMTRKQTWATFVFQSNPSGNPCGIRFHQAIFIPGCSAPAVFEGFESLWLAPYCISLKVVCNPDPCFRGHVEKACSLWGV